MTNPIIPVPFHGLIIVISAVCAGIEPITTDAAVSIISIDPPAVPNAMNLPPGRNVAVVTFPQLIVLERTPVGVQMEQTPSPKQAIFISSSETKTIFACGLLCS